MNTLRPQNIRFFVATVAVAVAVSLASTPGLADSLDSYRPGFLKQAERALHNGHAQEALTIVARKGPEGVKTRQWAEAQGLVCRAHLALNENSAALKACTTAASLIRDRSSWRFVNNLGVAQLRLGNHEAAATAFTRAAVLSGWSRTPRKNLGTLNAYRAAGAGTASTVVATIRR